MAGVSDTALTPLSRIRTDHIRMIHWAMLLTRTVPHVADEIRIDNFTVSVRQTLSASELFRRASLLKWVGAAISVVFAFFTLAVDTSWIACQRAVTVCYTL